jgi:hypothetical protein
MSGVYTIQCNLLLTTHLNPIWTRVIISPEPGGFVLQRSGITTGRDRFGDKVPSEGRIASRSDLEYKLEPKIVNLFSVVYSNLVQSTRTETKVVATSRNSHNNMIGDYTFEFDSVLDAKCFHELVSGNITSVSKSLSY